MQVLPRKIQTLLFSATVTKSLKELARLNLNKPEFIQIHNFDSVEFKASNPAELAEETPELKQVTPLTLLHYYMELKIDEKLDMLFSFLKLHQKQKILVFFSSRKQVRFAYQAFKSLKVNPNLLEFHGKMD